MLPCRCFETSECDERIVRDQRNEKRYDKYRFRSNGQTAKPASVGLRKEAKQARQR